MPFGRNNLWMVTENKHKFGEARKILSSYGFSLRQERIPKSEIQSQDLREIAMHALEEARSHSPRGRRLIVEDSGLFIDALRGFPGAYSSYVHKTLGVKGILRLMRGTTNRNAHFESAVALSTSNGRRRLFTGRVLGQISLRAHGIGGFGFDPIFIPRSADSTFAELGDEFKNRESHRAAALRKLAVWLNRERG